MIITSTENNKIKELRKLNEKKFRDEKQLFLVEGNHLVEEAYKNNILLEIIALDGDSFELDVPVTYVSDNVMASLSNLTTPSNIIGVCNMIEEGNELGEHILVLDSIQDPGNLGTIIRSSVAFNIDTIVLGKGTVDLYNPKVLRATQGLVFHINIIERELESFILELKDNDYKILGTDVIGGTDVKNYKAPSKYALIMGNEGHGLNNSIKELCDNFIYIKMNNACESLNVSVACSIILYQLDER